jgi:uncharacterized protein (TIGR02217 family)
MAFLESPRFPDRIAYGSSGGPKYQTTVAVTGGGHESRNADWEQARHRYDVAYGVRSLDDLEALIEFFHAAQGRAYGFRFWDPGDYKSCRTDTPPAATDQDQNHNGSTTTQLIKTYSRGTLSRVRDIRKPVGGTVVVAVDGAESSAYSLDTTTGIITWDHTSYSIQAVDTGNNVVELTGDLTGTMSAGDSFEISGSTGNDGVYTISALTYDSGNNRTEITTSKSIDDSTADGNVLHGQPNASQTVTAGYEFDVPVRFDIDELSTVHEDYRQAQAEAPLVEVRV